MRVRDLVFLIISAVLFCTSHTAAAQAAADSTDFAARENLLKSKVDSLRESMSRRRTISVSELRGVGDSLRLRYDFASSVRALEAALDASADSLERLVIEDKLLLSRNGLSMSEYCSRPIVVARKRFSVSDFFLYYPMRDSSWRSLPNPLDSLSTHPLVHASYVPEDASSLYYSGVDSNSVRNVYYTEFQDSAWTAPRLVNESLTTAHDEIYPVLSEDGKTLWFASAGLYGMGGYDLYVSHWNERTRDWDVPTNLGFPYSSPYDDFLYYNSDDGRYTIFASNRDCPSDSVNVYVLEYDSLPLHSAVSEPSELRRLAALEPDILRPTAPSNPAPSPAAPQPMGEDMASYLEQMNTVLSLRDSLNAASSELDALRASLSSASEDARKDISATILRKEMDLIPLQKALTEAGKTLQATEMEFLEKGVVIDPDRLMAPAAENAPAEEAPAQDFRFVRRHWGKTLEMKFLPPETEKVLPYDGEDLYSE